jgi:hypothetical protein
VTAGGAGAGALELGAQPPTELEGAQVGTEDQAGVSEDQAGVSEETASTPEGVTLAVAEAVALVRPGQSVTVAAQEVMVTSSVS